MTKKKIIRLRPAISYWKGQINWHAIENANAARLIDYGFHGSTISRCTGLTLSQVYYRSRKMKRRLRDYRDGVGPVAEVLVKKFSVVQSTKRKLK